MWYFLCYNPFKWPLKNPIKITDVSFLSWLCQRKQSTYETMLTHREGTASWTVSNINIDIAGARVFIMFILSTLHQEETISVIERAVQKEEIGRDGHTVGSWGNHHFLYWLVCVEQVVYIQYDDLIIFPGDRLSIAHTATNYPENST